ncbi:alpha/beta fold hydrolase [Streptomyces avidinii]|uniref:thioesterase II family protein n=1 Tax=Streptomyces avidinii TaxID=1895 RepID=UPI00386A97D3|nr:alpha/beta fold hydrolase [Streptomyces avidinii]
MVCFHHAGGGAGQFRTWQASFGPDVQVLAVQLPGRQTRWAEEPMTDIGAMVEALVPPLLARLDRPYVVFGHSMGGILGYELTRRLGEEYGRWPRRLIVSATPAPHLRLGRPDPEGLEDEELVESLIASGALPAWVREDPELREMMLPPLRGDYAACRAYRHRPGPPLPCPMTVFGATGDTISSELLGSWRSYTAAGFTQQMYPGDHFYHLNPASGLLTDLAELVAADAAFPPAGAHTEGTAR